MSNLDTSETSTETPSMSTHTSGNDNNAFQYWASTDIKKLGGHLNDKIDEYYKFVWATGLNIKWLKSYLTYYMNYANNAQIMRGGDQAEYAIISIAEAANIVQHLMNLIVSDRPAWEPRAANADVKTQRQTILARGLLDYYMREKRVERDLIQAVEYGLCFGEGFVSLSWDSTAGELYSFDEETQEPLNTGDLKYKSHEPIDVIRDTRLNTFRDRDWLIVREWENKYNLIAKFPEFAKDIDGIPSTITEQQHYRFAFNFPYNTDQIPVFKFYHSKTAALPEGRYTMFLSDQTILEDGKLPYRHIPVSRTSPRDVIGQSFGHAPMYDLIPLNDNLNMLYSTILTNQETFGTQNIMAPSGSNINYEQLAGGLNFIEYNVASGGKPEVMQMLDTPAEIFNTVRMITDEMAQVSGINSVTRGQAPSADMSGAAMALLEQSAISFTQPAQWSYVQMLEDVGTLTVQTLQDYAEIPRIITIAGKNNRSDTREFSGKDIEGVDRVLVDIANPMSKTPAGKMQIAQMLLEAKAISMPDEILQVLNTGNLDPLIEGKTSELLGLKAENEALMEGTPVQVLLTDDHMLHINEHKSLLSDPMARTDPKVVQAVSQHIQAHVAALSDPANANLLKLMGQPSLAAAPPAQQPTGPQPLPAGAAQAPTQANGSVTAAPQGSQEMIQQMQPNLPKGPVNPLSHQRVPLKPNGAH